MCALEVAAGKRVAPATPKFGVESELGHQRGVGWSSVDVHASDHPSYFLTRGGEAHIAERLTESLRLKLESARPGVISNAHPFKSLQPESPVPFSTSVNSKQQSRLKYSYSLMSISLRLRLSRASAAQRRAAQPTSLRDRHRHLDNPECFRQSQQHALKSESPDTRSNRTYQIAGKSMPRPRVQPLRGGKSAPVKCPRG